jgi:hypothetical protein
MSGPGCGTIKNRPFRLKILPAEASAPQDSRPKAASFLWGQGQPRDPEFPAAFRLAIVRGSLPAANAYAQLPAPEPVEIGIYPEFRQIPLPAGAPKIPERLLPIIVEPGADDAPPIEAPLRALPRAGLRPFELHCRSRAGAIGASPQWEPLAISAEPPPFAVQPALATLEDLAAEAAAKERPGKVDSAPQHHRKVSATTSLVIKAVAAGLVMAMSVWFGSGSRRSSRQETATNEDAPAAQESRLAPEIESRRGSDGGIATGPVEWVRTAVAQRAAAEFHETFRGDTKSWENASSGSPAKWERHPRGYVKPGPLALFQPSLGFTDYRFEFLGQIENQSMGWVVRAQDRKNYYATKVKVVKPGLRPIIAIEHYAVVAGKPGHRVEMPLNVMVHNDVPYRVAVVVKGNHLVTSIEDQEVDTWTDDSLPEGGVGFFGEAGESARLYWMRLTRNQDVWGRVCAYISSGLGPATETAAIAPGPAAGLPERRFAGGKMRANSRRQGRMEAWKC